MVAKTKPQSAAPAPSATTTKKNAGSVATALKSVLTEKTLSAPKPAVVETKQPAKAVQAKRKAPTDAAKPVVAKKEIPMRVEKEQVVAASTALLSFVKKQQEAAVGGLFDEDPYFFIMIALQRFPAKTKTKPIRIPIPHSLYGREGVDICLITKDPQSDYEEKLESEPVQGVKKVLGVSTLRSDYKQYKDRLQLLSEYDLFLADERVLPLLPALLGSKFFEKKKHPAAVNLTKKSLAHELCNARDATYMHLTGPSLMIKVAKSSFSRQHIVDNIMTAIPRIVEQVPRKWKNIQAIYLRTHDSVALPLYNAIPSSKPAKAEAAAVAAPAASETKAIEAPAKSPKKAPAAKKVAVPAKTDDTPADEKKAEAPKVSAKRARGGDQGETKAPATTNGASPAKKAKGKAEGPADAKPAATPKAKAAPQTKKPATKAR